MTTTNTLTVANEILNQLGGGRFKAMTGVKHVYGDENSLGMHLTKNKIKAKYLKITLDDSDTYTMEFSTMKGYDFVVLQKYEMVYADMLQDLFTEATGLYTHL